MQDEISTVSCFQSMIDRGFAIETYMNILNDSRRLYLARFAYYRDNKCERHIEIERHIFSDLVGSYARVYNMLFQGVKLCQLVHTSRY
jgi:neutral trehalase